MDDGCVHEPSLASVGGDTQMVCSYLEGPYGSTGINSTE
jgi:hypothetical protein